MKLHINPQNALSSLGVTVLQVYTHKNQVFVKQEPSETSEAHTTSWSPVPFHWKSH
jgi:hypothetical protein